MKDIYAPFTQEEISRKIVEMLTADGSINAEVDIIYQTLEWYRGNTDMSWRLALLGDYPTPGGVRLVNRAYVTSMKAMLTSADLQYHSLGQAP